MREIIKKTIRIYNAEIYNGFVYRLLINLLLLLFIVGLQFGDITFKVSSNYFVITWVSINVCLSFSLFIKKNRAFLLDLSSLSGYRKLFMLYLVSGIMNIGWGLFIFFHLLFIMRATVQNAFTITVLQYAFALSIGALGGALYKKHVGITLIICLAIANFVFYNPLLYDGSSHFFSISEQLYVVDVPNTINIISLVLLILFSTFATGILSKSDKRFIAGKLIIIVILCVATYTSIIFHELSKYESLTEDEYITMRMGEHIIEYKDIPVDKVKVIYSIVSEFEEHYRDVQTEFRYSKYKMDKIYLSALTWRIKGTRPKPVAFNKDTINIHALSDSMLNFKDADLLRNFIDEIKYAMVLDIKGYNQCRYTRQLIEGYSIAFMKEISGELDLEQSQKVEDYYTKDIDEIFSLPTTQSNYVYRVALIIFNKFPSSVGEVYNLTLTQNPKSNQEFIELLEDNFEDIAKDEDMQAILSRVHK